MNKAMLVTGGAGAIGCNLVKRLADSGTKTVVIDNLSSGHRNNVTKSKNIVFIKGDIANNSDLKKVFSYNISAVFHLAANFANQNSVEHPKKDLRTNILGTLKLLEYAVMKKIDKFIYVSSSCVYGNKSSALKENFLDLKHDTPYSISKLTAEKYVSFFNDYYGLKTSILRYFNVYGPGEMPGKYRNVIPNFFYKAIKGESLTITGTGEETRDFTFVEEVVTATVKALETSGAVGEIFNIGSGVETNILTLANKINDIAGNKARIVFKKRRNWDNVLRRRADITKAKNVLGHKISVGLDEGLLETYKWLIKELSRRKIYA